MASASRKCPLNQRATDPTGARLIQPEIRLKLLRENVQFFRQQLEQESLKLLLVNGQSAVSHPKRSGVCDSEVRSGKDQRAKGIGCPVDSRK